MAGNSSLKIMVNLVYGLGRSPVKKKTIEEDPTRGSKQVALPKNLNRTSLGRRARQLNR